MFDESNASQNEQMNENTPEITPTPEGSSPEPTSSEQPKDAPTPAEAKPIEVIRPAFRVEKKEVTVPGPEADADLNKEIDEALGDVSLMDLYNLEGNEEDVAKTDADKPSGVKTGRVISVTDEGLFVDMSGKSQGFLPREELEEGENYEPGQAIEVAIIRYDNRDGLLILSRKTAEQQLLVSNLKEGVMVEARVTGKNKGGLELSIKGLGAFMPISQIELGRVEDLEPYINQKMICEVTQVERGDKNIVVSRRNVLLKEREEQEAQAWEEIQEGQMRHGVVRSLMEYGAFVDIGGVDGLLHVKEMSWAHVKHPRDILSVGQGVDVVIITIDREKNRIGLSLRQAGGDPWTRVEQQYPVGSHHQAQIKNLADFGAFAELEPGVEGLIPISQMSWAGRIRHPSDVVQSGMLVNVEVMSVDVTKKRISLSMKKMMENPWTNIRDKYTVEQICTGKVARIADFGVFVTLEPGIDGLVHVSEIANHRINHPADVVKDGQEVQVKILSVDDVNQRIALSIKGAEILGVSGVSGSMSEPDPQGIAEMQAADEKSHKPKKERPRRGGLTW